ncbi:MAG: glycosyltransferase [Rhodospirillaceae bacterium]
MSHDKPSKEEVLTLPRHPGDSSATSQTETANRLLAERDWQIAQLRLAVAARDEQIGAKNQEIEALLHSSSWRITAPLRSLVDTVRRLGGGSPPPLQPAPLQPMNAMPEAGWPNVKRWYDENDPEVSVIILNWNKSQLTIACLQSLWQHTSGFRYEIVVVDNGSTAEELCRLKDFPGHYRLVCLPVNLFFGEGNNIGAEIAGGQFVVFMNNDAFATPNWLPPLMAVLADRADAGAVGPKFLFPDGRLQEAGVLCAPDGTVYQRGAGGSADDPAYQTLREVHYCSAACLLMRRDLFLQVLGFDWCWEPVFYEDADLCLKLGRLGRTVYYCPGSTIIHIGNATIADSSRQLNGLRIFEINRARFTQRWASFLQCETGKSPSLVEAAPPTVPAADQADGRVGLYLSDRLAANGNSRVLLAVALALAADSPVTVIVPVPCSRLRLLTVARMLGLELKTAQVQIATLEEATTQTFGLFIALSEDILPPGPGLGRRNILISRRPAPPAGVDHGAAVWWSDYEAVVVESPAAHSQAEALIRTLALPGKPIRIIPPPVGSVESDGNNKEDVIIQVGRFDGSPSSGRSHETVIDAFRTLADGNPTIRLTLAGYLPPEACHLEYFRLLQARSAGLRVDFHPNASRDELTALYRRATVCWQTARPAGTLSAIAVLEAMSCGCIPVVISQAGLLPFIEHERSGFRVETAAALIDTSRRILANRQTPWAAGLMEAAAIGARAYGTPAFIARWQDLRDEYR